MKIWYVPVVVIVRWSRKLLTMSHIVGHSSTMIRHYQSRSCSPSHHDLSDHTSSKI